MTTTTLRDTGVHVEDTGSGPTILCLHGIGSSSASFAPQVAALAGTVPVDYAIPRMDAPKSSKQKDPEFRAG
ncbi:alpha/beta hydrolase, partial [Nocardioides sp. NPDC000441]|uniref:alpha/beta fold hydrolase n=1 Tax=Nocardioides sp. NPDC000441 TaxID=3154256 RepID=UPI0033180D11